MGVSIRWYYDIVEVDSPSHPFFFNSKKKFQTFLLLEKSIQLLS